MSNNLTAEKRDYFLSHPIIRIGKTLFDKFSDLQSFFWKEKSLEDSSPLIIDKSKGRKRRRHLSQSEDFESTMNVDLLSSNEEKKTIVRPTEEKKRIKSRMNEVHKFRITHNLKFD